MHVCEGVTFVQASVIHLCVESLNVVEELLIGWNLKNPLLPIYSTILLFLKMPVRKKWMAVKWSLRTD